MKTVVGGSGVVLSNIRKKQEVRRLKGGVRPLGLRFWECSESLFGLNCFTISCHNSFKKKKKTIFQAVSGGNRWEASFIV